MIKLLQSSKNSISQKTLSEILQVGFATAFPIAGGGLLGFFLDKKYGTAPKATLILLFIGIILSFSYLWKVLKDFADEGKENK